MANHSVKVRRKKRNPFVPFIVLLIFLALVSFVLAWAWQKLSGGESTSSSSVVGSSSSSSQSSSETSSSSSGQSSSSQDNSSKESESSSQSESGSGEGPSDSRFEGAVPKAERVKNSYFDNAVFLGDSITQGISLYSVMSNTNVVAGTGVNLESILTKQVVKDKAGNKATALEALKSYDPQKIYIMLGSNGIEFMDTDTIVRLYGELIDEIKAQHPGVTIYVQSILPVTKALDTSRPGLANSVIDACNLSLLTMAKDKGVNYLHVAESFKDAQGNLPNDASPSDGMHFGPSYYEKWFEYLKAHTVS